MASSERTHAAASLLLRILTLLLLIAALSILVTDKIYIGPFDDVVSPPNITFRDFYAYRYVLAVAVIGCAYILLLLPFAAIHVAQGRRVGRDPGIALLIFTDVVFAVFIATGAAAGLGLTVEYQRYSSQDSSDFKNFYNLVDVSCGLMLGATICMVIMIMISVHSLT